MKHVIHLLFAFAVLSAADNGQTSYSLQNPVRPDPGRDVISITPLGSYAITFTTSLLGIDDMGDNSDVLFAIDPLHENIVGFEGLTGTYIAALADIHPNNADAFGIGMNTFGSPYILTNDCSDTGLFAYSGVWSILDNPAGDNGMGMEFDGTWLWQVVSDGALHRLLAWQPDGTTLWYDVSAYIPGQLVGCACFWDPLHIAVTCENSDDIYVFQIDGSSYTYIGSADLSFIPGEHSDLAYCEHVDRFFMSYTIGYACNIAMFEMDINVPLERGTWAGIKSSFCSP
jgi:hypothetical protein